MSVAAPASLSVLRSLLDAGLAAQSLDLDAHQHKQLLDYVLLLDKWNKVYNLTAVREPEKMIGLHILDSLSVLNHLGSASTLIDVGTGGGLPGVPLAIARPGLRVTMLDTIAKKTTFVRQAVAELGLSNADVVTARVETYAPEAAFDVVISRAFAELNDFVRGAGHLCADTGCMLAMKGVHPHDEISRLPAGFFVTETVVLNVPSVEGQRHLVVIRKNQADQ
ncbi:MAG: 16S rRNA (guanine(527)-N(7))-methyltransferase RsmG [Betaproteobacteria bacterium]